MRVRPGQRVTVDGKLLPAAEATRLFRYHKPKGVVTAARDPEGRATIYDTLPEGLPRLMPVGRLDIGSEGLLLLTNDGALKRRLELPATGWLRRYRVRAFGEVDDRQLQRPGAGGHRRRRRLRPDRGPARPAPGRQCLAHRVLARGQEPRGAPRARACRACKVNRLIRMAYGPFQLGTLPKRSVEEVLAKVLREQIGGTGGAARSRRAGAPPPAARG